MRWTLIFNARVSSTLPIIIRPQWRRGWKSWANSESKLLCLARGARYRPNSSMKRRNDLPQIAKRRHVVDPISMIVSVGSRPHLGFSDRVGSLVRREKSVLERGFSDRRLFSIGDSLAMKGERANFPMESYQLSVTFWRTRPSDSLVNGVNIWLWQRTTFNAGVKTSAIYACRIMGSIEENYCRMFSLYLNCKFMQHVRSENANTSYITCLLSRRIHNTL